RSHARPALLGEGERLGAYFARGGALGGCDSLCAHARFGIRRAHALGLRLASSEPRGGSGRRRARRSAVGDRALRNAAACAARGKPEALLPLSPKAQTMTLRLQDNRGAIEYGFLKLPR